MLTGGPVAGVKREDGGLRQAVSHQAAQPGHYPATRSDGPPDQGCCSAGAASSGSPGSEGEGQGVAAVRGGRGGHHESGEQAAGRVLKGMDGRQHYLEGRIGGV